MKELIDKKIEVLDKKRNNISKFKKIVEKVLGISIGFCALMGFCLLFGKLYAAVSLFSLVGGLCSVKNYYSLNRENTLKRLGQEKGHLNTMKEKGIDVSLKKESARVNKIASLKSEEIFAKDDVNNAIIADSLFTFGLGASILAGLAIPGVHAFICPAFALLKYVGDYYTYVAKQNHERILNRLHNLENDQEVFTIANEKRKARLQNSNSNRLTSANSRSRSNNGRITRNVSTCSSDKDSVKSSTKSLSDFSTVDAYIDYLQSMKNSGCEKELQKVKK